MKTRLFALVLVGWFWLPSLGFSATVVTESDFNVSATPAPLDHIPLSKATYASTVEKGQRLAIDENSRVRTTIQITLTTTGARAPVTFPFHLKWDDLKLMYTTRGSFAFQFFTTMGTVVNCTFPITLDLDLYNGGQAADATYTYPQSMFIDAYGICRYVGSQTAQIGYTRIAPGPTTVPPSPPHP